ncbi:hypothetical protein SEVIR_5G097601v4, partial [Setaria viridis]
STTKRIRRINNTQPRKETETSSSETPLISPALPPAHCHGYPGRSQARGVPTRPRRRRATGGNPRALLRALPPRQCRRRRSRRRLAPRRRPVPRVHSQPFVWFEFDLAKNFGDGGADGVRAWPQGGGPYGKQVTRGQDLTGKDFSGQTLVKQDFKTSILRQANFKGANLLGASFFDADLTSADLSDADLRGADFSLANLTKVNLTNANLEGALTTGNTTFKGANITGADFTDVPLRDDQREYLCKIADGVNSTTGNATKETLFCN